MKDKSITYEQITSNKQTPSYAQIARTPSTPTPPQTPQTPQSIKNTPKSGRTKPRTSQTPQRGSGLSYFKPDHEQNRAIWKT